MPLMIVIDSRESRSPVWQLLHRDPTLDLEIRELPCADYLPHPEFGIERKDATDFVMSIMDRRLFAQVKRLKDEYSPMACARRLSAMEYAGEASSADPHGTANDLARQFTLTG